MKKFCVFILCISTFTFLVSGCTIKQQTGSMVKSKRRFAQYMEPENKQPEGVVDLSEGPRQNYDARFGPKNLEFDIKIVDPY